MSTFKTSMSKIGKYLREVSVVVIGVAITFVASNAISNRNEKREMALSLNAITIELERNVIAFEDYARRLQKSANYQLYIHSHDEKSISEDSILYYALSGPDGIGWGNTTQETVLIRDAFDMFKTLGNMRYVTNKEVLVSIWEIYSEMENAQRVFDGIMQMKNELSINEMLRMEEKATVPLRLFYSLGATSTMISRCNMISARIKEVLSKLETAQEQ